MLSEVLILEQGFIIDRGSWKVVGGWVVAWRIVPTAQCNSNSIYNLINFIGLMDCIRPLLMLRTSSERSGIIMNV